MQGAEGPGAFTLSVDESKGQTVGKGHFEAESVCSAHCVPSSHVCSLSEKSL